MQLWQFPRRGAGNCRQREDLRRGRRGLVNVAGRPTPGWRPVPIASGTPGATTTPTWPPSASRAGRPRGRQRRLPAAAGGPGPLRGGPQGPRRPGHDRLPRGVLRRLRRRPGGDRPGRAAPGRRSRGGFVVHSYEGLGDEHQAARLLGSSAASSSIACPSPSGSWPPPGPSGPRADLAARPMGTRRPRLGPHAAAAPGRPRRRAPGRGRRSMDHRRRPQPPPPSRRDPVHPPAGRAAHPPPGRPGRRPGAAAVGR